ncbi:MAG TPA: hypothetical protein VF065_12545 [Ilumatobacter sp.]
MAIVPDDKNWTWVLERPCPDCGLETSTVDVSKPQSGQGRSSTHVQFLSSGTIAMFEP